MSETSFRFKHFTVNQDKCAMKVGTDGVLLGAWVNPDPANLILDVGTGSGLLALMLAQKSTAEIHALDIDENSYKQARENFFISPWFDRLKIFHLSIQDFVSSTQNKYDLIVSNPPYFHHAPKPNEVSRSFARHDDQLTFKELIIAVKNILSDKGRFCIILPRREGTEFLDIAMGRGLFCSAILKVKTKINIPEKRLLMEFTHTIKPMSESTITLRDKNDQFSADYIELTKDYLLHL